MYGAYCSNAAKKVQVPGQFRLGNPGSALPGMSSAHAVSISEGAIKGHKSFPYKLPISPA